MDSLNHAGKMCAQAAHAANMAADAMNKLSNGVTGKTREAWSAWEKSTPQGFGTVLVMGTIVDPRKVKIDGWGTRDEAIRGLNLDDLYTLTDAARRIGYAAGIVNDPTYPLQDGKVMHGFPCDTCAWIFGSKEGLAAILKNVGLHGESAK